jgi:hypothetical protein
MTKLINNAEGGSNTTTVTTANSGGSSGSAFDVVTIGSGAALTFDNAHAAHGALSYKFVASSSGSVVSAWTTSLTGSSVTQVWFRTYVYITANPVIALKLVEAMSSTTQRASVSVGTTGKITLQNAAGTTLLTSTTTVPLNQWFRIEGFFIGSATVGQIECKIFTTSANAVSPDETLTTTAVQNNGGTINRLQFGNPTSGVSYTHWMDEVGASDTAYLGPVKTVTGTIKLKKMVVSGTSHEKAVIAGTIKLKKLRLAMSSGELFSSTGVIKLKKLRLSGALFPFGTIPRISWDTGVRTYFQGVSQGVLYVRNSPGVPWNGLISVTEKGDAKSDSFYIDGQLYRIRNVPDTFAGTISAYTYPDELEPYLGVVNGITGQPKNVFGLTYRSNNELHIVYNVLLAPSSDDYTSLADNVTPLAFSWGFTTLPEKIPGGRSSSHLVISIDSAHSGALSGLEDIIYGDDANSPSLPSVQAVIDLFSSYAEMIITDNGDGTWTATGPDDSISLVGDVFTITWPSATFINAEKYSIRTL